MAEEDESAEDLGVDPDLFDDDDGDFEPFMLKTPIVFIMGLLVPPLGFILARRKENWTNILQLLASLTALLGFGAWCVPPTAYSVSKVMHVSKRFGEMERALGFGGAADFESELSDAAADVLRIRGACITDTGGILATQRFLKHLDKLMDDFEPAFGEKRGKTYPCVTESRLKLDPEYVPLRRHIRIARQRAGRIRLQKEFEYEDSGYLKEHTFSKNLAELKAPSRYACFYYNKLTDQREYFSEEFSSCKSPRNKKKSSGVEMIWAPLEEGPAYKEGETPELMKRMQSNELEPPRRITCLVDEIYPDGEVMCRGQKGFMYGLKVLESSLSKNSELLKVRNGDVVAVETEDEDAPNLITEIRKAAPDDVWIFGVFEGSALKVVERSTCCEKL